jgi:hypothetical protein
MIEVLPIRKTIKFVCIDNKNVRAKIPKFVISVPCIILGETNQILVGRQIIQWLQVQPTALVPPQSQSDSSGASEDKGPNPFLYTEMSCFSDNYSFIGADTSASGNGGASIVHNFEFLTPSQNVQGNSSNSLPGNAKPNIPVSYDNKSGFNSDFGALQNKDSSDMMTKELEKRINARQKDCDPGPRRN